MAKWQNDAMLDAALNYIKNGATRLVILSGAVTTYAGVAAATLGTVTIDTTDFTGPADGDTNGRKLTVNAQSGTASASGTATHVGLHNNTDTLYYVTTCPSKTVNSSDPFDVSAWDIEVADVTP